MGVDLRTSVSPSLSALLDTLPPEHTSPYSMVAGKSQTPTLETRCGREGAAWYASHSSTPFSRPHRATVTWRMGVGCHDNG